MKTLVDTFNESPTIRDFAKKLAMNQTPEQVALNVQAFELTKKIVKLKPVDNYLHRCSFKDQKIWFHYLGDIPQQVQNIVQKAFEIRDPEQPLSKDRILHNFIMMCTAEGMEWLNPFNLFTLEPGNLDGLLRGKF